MSVVLRRAVTGVAFGCVTIGYAYSRWGRRSGGHLNPAMILAFFRLGKIAPPDGIAHVIAQLAGAASGVLLAGVLLGSKLRDVPLTYLVTRPGQMRPGTAFLVELGVCFLLMALVLWLSNSPKYAAYTGICAGVLTMICVPVFAGISGASFNPGRSFGSALAAWDWQFLWIYFIAPCTGMLLAARAFLFLYGPDAVKCAKLCHDCRLRCIFRCRYARQSEPHSSGAME
jgi:aquaporin Z